MKAAVKDLNDNKKMMEIISREEWKSKIDRKRIENLQQQKTTEME